MAELLVPILPSRLYRYRSLARDPRALTQELESISAKYLFCSPFSRMNDPMEGFFRPSQVLQRSQFRSSLNEITNAKSNIGIACFTETFEDVLMWAHYAGNYNGICISYYARALVLGLPADSKVVRLTYVDEPPLVYPSHVRNMSKAAVHILSQKKYAWAYEREWRVLAHVGEVPIESEQPVRAIYLGSRISQDHRKTILQRIKRLAIKAYAMKVDGYAHTWEPINAAARGD